MDGPITYAIINWSLDNPAVQVDSTVSVTTKATSATTATITANAGVARTAKAQMQPLLRAALHRRAAGVIRAEALASKDTELLLVSLDPFYSGLL